MRRLIFTLACLALLTSCDPQADKTSAPEMGTFILNNGNWGDNDSNIGIYNARKKTFSPDVFLSVNGMNLGDLAQDIIICGDDIYIAVYGSQTIFVTDQSLKITAQINIEKDGQRLSPRHFTSSDGKVYVSCYEGYVGEIDPADYSVRLAEVGQNPEGLVSAGGNIYVANTGGMAYPDYDNTLSVVSEADFRETSTIEVNVNPSKVVATSDGTLLYVFSYGDYAAVPPMVQMLDTSSGKLSDLGYTSVSAMAKGRNDILYILCGGYDEQWNPLSGKVFVHDMKKNVSLGEFVADGTVLPDAYSISCASDGYVYVGCSDYKNTGDMYVFSTDGRLHDKFDTAGLNPIGAY